MYGNGGPGGFPTQPVWQGRQQFGGAGETIMRTVVNDYQDEKGQFGRQVWQQGGGPVWQHQQHHQAGPGRLLATVHNRPVSPLPERVYECCASLLFPQDFLQCGVLELSGQSGRTARCLFFQRDLVNQAWQERLSLLVGPQSRLLCSAWLVDREGRIPYLAAAVWHQGGAVPRGCLERLQYNPSQAALEEFNTKAATLAWQLPEPGQANMSSRNVVIVEEDKQQQQERCVVFQDTSFHEEEDKYAMQDRNVVFNRSFDGSQQATCDSTRSGRQVRERSWSPMGQFRQSLQAPRHVRVWDGPPPAADSKVLPSENTTVRRSRSPLTDSRRRRGQDYSESYLDLEVQERRQANRNRSPISSHRHARSRSRNRRSSSLGRRSSSASHRSSSRKRRSSSRGRKVSHQRKRSRSPPAGNSRRQRWKSMSKSPVRGPVPELRKSLNATGDQDSASRRYRRKSRTRSKSPIRKSRKLHSSSPIQPCSEFLQQSVLARGGSAKISSYITDEIGMLTVYPDARMRDKSSGGGDRLADRCSVYFHIDQVWVRTPNVGFHKFREIFKQSLLRDRVEVGNPVWCNMRRVECRRADYQAMVVCLEPDYPDWVKQVGERETEEEHSLQYNLALIQHHESDKRTDLAVDPFPASTALKTVEGKIQEYFSLDVGFAKLTDTTEEATVLFHLNQVYVPKKYGKHWTRKTDFDDGSSLTLTQQFPVGTTVSLILAPLPCHINSQLRYQAAALYKKTYSSIEDSVVDFNRRFATVKVKIELRRTIDRNFETFKGLVKLNSNPFRFNPVHTVLNGLPDNWQAKVVAKFGQEFGMIRVSHMLGKPLSPDPVTPITAIMVMFHIEDVYGEQEVSMDLLQDRHVNLSARSICKRNKPSGVFEVLRQIIKTNPVYGDIPVLQAVTVSVKQSSTTPAPSHTLPRPTVLRSGPGAFGAENKSAYFMQHGLRVILDIKHVRFLAIKNKPVRPYKDHIESAFDFKQEKACVEELRALDCQVSRRLIFGQLDLLGVDITRQTRLPDQITRIECNLRYLHRTSLKTDKGLVEVKPLVDNVPVQCFAYFEISELAYQQSSYYCQDLALLTPVNSPDKFCVSLQLRNPSSKIPFVVTAIWNETVRLRCGDPEPLPVKLHNHARENAINALLDCYDKEKSKEQKTRSEASSSSEQKSDINNSTVTSPTLSVPRESTKKSPKTVVTFKSLVERVPSDDKVFGRVLRIVNGNYGLCIAVKTGEDGIVQNFEVLFDVYDVWVAEESKVLAELGKKLQDVMKVGDFVKLHHIKVQSCPLGAKRVVENMATFITTSNSAETILDRAFPSSALPIHDIGRIDSKKITNFSLVVKQLMNLDYDSSELEVIEEVKKVIEDFETKKSQEKLHNSSHDLVAVSTDENREIVVVKTGKSDKGYNGTEKNNEDIQSFGMAEDEVVEIKDCTANGNVIYESRKLNNSQDEMLKTAVLNISSEESIEDEKTEDLNKSLDEMLMSANRVIESYEAEN